MWGLSYLLHKAIQLRTYDVNRLNVIHILPHRHIIAGDVDVVATAKSASERCQWKTAVSQVRKVSPEYRKHYLSESKPVIALNEKVV